jgi:hypothetical protein
MFYLTVTAGLCAVASCAWAGVSFREGGVPPTTRSPLPSTIVERMHKADRMAGASNARGAGVPAFSIETANSLESTVTLRDSNGSILYQVSPMDRTTTVAKRAAQKPILSDLREHLSAKLTQLIPRENGVRADLGCELGLGQTRRISAGI